MRAETAVTTGAGAWVTESGEIGGRAPASLRSRSLISAWVSHGLAKLEAGWQGGPRACPPWLNPHGADQRAKEWGCDVKGGNLRAQFCVAVFF